MANLRLRLAIYDHSIGQGAVNGADVLARQIWRGGPVDRATRTIIADQPRWLSLLGSHLGAFRTPAREDDLRSVSQTFYYAQQDYLADRQADASWTWSASRPHCICHAVPDSPRNIVLVVAAYAAICREMARRPIILWRPSVGWPTTQPVPTRRSTSGPY